MPSTKESTAMDPSTGKVRFFHMYGSETLLFNKMNYSSSRSDNIYRRKHNLTALEYEVNDILVSTNILTSTLEVK